MKQFISGVVSTFFFTISVHAVWTCTIDYSSEHQSKLHGVAWDIEDNIIHGDYLINPLTGRCSIEKGKEGYSNAEYFGCDRFQKLINVKHGH